MLQNKVILVTGSTTGIGRAIAEACLESGASVMLHGRDARPASLLLEIYTERADIIHADLIKTETLDELIDATVARFGRIDALVNNAGIYPRNRIEESSPELFDSIFAINVKAPLLLSKRAIHYFRKQRSGVILNIGSINAHCGQSNLLIYSMSKGALMTMTRNLAEQVTRDGIRVNQLNVGWTVTETELETKRKEGLPDHWQENLPRIYAPNGQLLTPEQVARHAVFWLSDFSDPCSGQVYELEQYPLIGRNLIDQMVTPEQLLKS